MARDLKFVFIIILGNIVFIAATESLCSWLLRCLTIVTLPSQNDTSYLAGGELEQQNNPPAR